MGERERPRMSIHKDLQKRLSDAHAMGSCLISESRADDRRLRAACVRGDLISPFHHVYADPSVWRSLKPTEREMQRLRAIAKLHPDWVFASVSAALLRGLAVSYSLIGRVHIVTNAQSHSRSSHDIERHIIPDADTDEANGIRVTTLGRTAFDCMRTYGFRESLAICDSVLRQTEKPGEQLAEAFGAFHRANRRKEEAVQIALLGDGRAENGGESIARAVMIEQGFQLPELQVEIPTFDKQGEPYRADFFWQLGDGRQVAGELDGREKYRNPQMTGGRDIVDILADERLRESRISANDIRVMRFSFSDVTHVGRFRQIMGAFGIPDGNPVPAVAQSA